MLTYCIPTGHKRVQRLPTATYARLPFQIKCSLTPCNFSERARRRIEREPGKHEIAPPPAVLVAHGLTALAPVRPSCLKPDLLNSWVYAIVVKDWKDIAVVIHSHLMPFVECGERLNGTMTKGWNCLFLPMPHLCIFDNDMVNLTLITGQLLAVPPRCA